MTLSRMVHKHGLQLKEDLHEYFVPFVASDTSSAGNLIEPWRQVATKEAVPYFIKRFPFETPVWTQWQAAAKPDYSGKWLVVGHDLARGGAWRPKPAE